MVLEVCVDVLAGDDGIVDHDTEDQDKREQADQVNRDAHGGHQCQRAQEADGDPDAHPYGYGKTQEQGE